MVKRSNALRYIEEGEKRVEGSRQRHDNQILLQIFRLDCGTVAWIAGQEEANGEGRM